MWCDRLDLNRSVSFLFVLLLPAFITVFITSKQHVLMQFHLEAGAKVCKTSTAEVTAKTEFRQMAARKTITVLNKKGQH